MERFPLVLIDDFLPEASCGVLSGFIAREVTPEKANTSNKNVAFNGRQRSFQHISHPLTRNLMGLLRADTARIAAAVFGYAVLYPTFTDLVRWPAGTELDWHTDNAPDFFPWRVATGVVVLNDGFEGGAFRMRPNPESTDEERVAEPKRGQLMLYPAAVEHRVDPVTIAERHTLAMWFTADKHHLELP